MKLDCENLTKVKDITDQCKYKDMVSGDKRNFVSCCQDNGYNELNNKFNKFRNKFPSISNKIILVSICECCKKIPHYERTHKRFDECVENNIKFGEELSRYLKGKK